MPMRFVTTAAGIILIASLAGCGQDQAPEAASRSEGDQRLQIAVIPKATTFTFWKAVHAGAAAAADEAGAEIIWQGPSNEGDRRGQIDVVQNFVSRQVDAIVLAPPRCFGLGPPRGAGSQSRDSCCCHRLGSRFGLAE